jgi:hypothetical protein
VTVKQKIRNSDDGTMTLRIPVVEELQKHCSTGIQGMHALALRLGDGLDSEEGFLICLVTRSRESPRSAD